LFIGGGVFASRDIERLDALASRPAQSELWQPLLRDALSVGDLMRPLLDSQTVIQAEMFDTAVVAAVGRDVRAIWDMLDPRVTIVPPGGLLHMQAVGQTEQARMLLGAEVVKESTLPNGTRVVITVAELEERLSELRSDTVIQTEQGLTLIGAGVQVAEDGQWQLQTAWRVDVERLASDVMNFGSFAHGFDTAGERVQIIDGPRLSTEWWTVGDIHIHTMRFNADPRLAVLRVGQFDAETLSALRFITDAGQVDSIEVWAKPLN
jgi:hypothetical protein